MKKSESALITDPITVGPNDTLRNVSKITLEHNISGVPVLEGQRVVGILTNRDMRFHADLSVRVADAMTRELVTAKSA